MRRGKNIAKEGKPKGLGTLRDYKVFKVISQFSIPNFQFSILNSQFSILNSQFSILLLFLLLSFPTLAQTDIETLMSVSSNSVKEVIKYQARDSVAMDLNTRRAYLYTDGSIHYEDMELKADQVTVDFNRNTLHAHGTPDTNGNIIGRPFFKQADAEYHADTITFNYNTQKGIIHSVITQEGDGFLHGHKVKKLNDTVMYLSGGSYTTCNYAHPHFALNFTKSKLITGDKIVTGPAWLTIEDVPTPIAVPFGFFPITHERSSGILFPSYGWMNNRGYYLKDGGYYFALNDNLDLALLGEIYTNLSWAAEAKSNYYVRYKYKGAVDIRYGQVFEGIRGDTKSFKSYNDFKVVWRHDQDAKANPYSRFSANVNLQSRNYSKNTTNSSDYFNSTTTSSISYNTKIGSYFNLSASARESFNAQTGLMNIKLPSISLSSITVYPLRRRNPSGAYRWYENISLSYVLNAENNLSVIDSDLFKQTTLDRMQYGVHHRIPLSSSIKVLRFFNWTNSITYNERWHWSTIEKNYDTATGSVSIDTIHGFRPNRDFNISSSLSTRIYGLFQFKFGPVKALRHVINPSLSFSYRPDFGSERLGYWRQYTDNSGYVHRYSIFQQCLYGGPPDGRSGQLRLSVGNNLEMKVQNPFDTTAELKKIPLIESLNLSMSYDLAKDSLRLSNLTVTGRTTLFRTLVVNYSGSFCPYVIDNNGNLRNQLLWDNERRLFRTENSTWSTQFSWNLNNSTFSSGDKAQSKGQPVRTILQTPYNYDAFLMTGAFYDFSVPWNISLNYTFSYVNRYVASEMNLQSQTIQSITLSGNLSLTSNWRLAMTTGYDISNKGWSYTTIDIYHNLHCWEMRFSWVPFGYYKSWSFQINVKADALRDVKYEKKATYLDNNGYYSY